MSSTNLGSGNLGPGTSIRFLRWNIRGMGSPIKRNKVFAHLKHLNSDIMFLRERHLTLKDRLRLKVPRVGQVYHSDFNSKSQEVAILINKKIQFSSTNVTADKNGRYLIITGMLMLTQVLLVNVYAPNFDDVEFSNRLLSNILNLNTHLLIFGGDLNSVCDPVLDRSSPRKLSQTAMAKSFFDFIAHNGMVDPWRLRNPTLKKFSFFSHVHLSYSRIDNFFY